MGLNNGKHGVVFFLVAQIIRTLARQQLELESLKPRIYRRPFTNGTPFWRVQNVPDVLTLCTHGIPLLDDMLPLLRSTDYIHPSQIVRIHFLITGIVRLIWIQDVRCIVQVLAASLSIYNRLSFLTPNRPSLIMSVMWLLSPILHQIGHEKRTRDIYMLLHVYILSSKEDHSVV